MRGRACCSGVTVDPTFKSDETARRITRRYGLEIGVHSAIALALSFALGPLIGLLWQVFGGLFAFAHANRAAKPYASAENAVAQAGAGLLLPREDSTMGAALAFAPIALLFAFAVYARAHENQIPERFPVHFNFNGPDRWVDRSPRSMYALVAVSGLLCLIMILARYGMLYRSRRVAASGPAAQAEARFRNIILWLLIAVEYYAVAMPWVILFPIGPGIQLLNTGMIALAVIAIAVLFYMGQGGARLAPGAPAGDRTPDSCWKWGLFYINPRDPALFVEKRFGIGYRSTWGIAGRGFSRSFCSPRSESNSCCRDDRAREERFLLGQHSAQIDQDAPLLNPRDHRRIACAQLPLERRRMLGLDRDQAGGESLLRRGAAPDHRSAGRQFGTQAVEQREQALALGADLGRVEANPCAAPESGPSVPEAGSRKGASRIR